MSKHLHAYASIGVRIHMSNQAFTCIGHPSIHMNKQAFTWVPHEQVFIHISIQLAMWVREHVVKIRNKLKVLRIGLLRCHNVALAVTSSHVTMCVDVL